MWGNSLADIGLARRGDILTNNAGHDCVVGWVDLLRDGKGRPCYREKAGNDESVTGTIT